MVELGVVQVPPPTQVIESEEYKQGKQDWGGMDEVQRTFEGTVPYVQDALKFISPERAWAMCDRDWDAWQAAFAPGSARSA